MRGAVTEIFQAAKEVTDVSKEMGLNAGDNSNKQQDKANTQQANANFTVGQTLFPKINNISLFQASSKSSSVMKKLTKTTDLIFTGQTQNGLMQVTTEHGEGWVEAHLIQ